MNIDKSPFHNAIYELCLEIEKLPASEQQTKVVTAVGALEKYADELFDVKSTLDKFSKTKDGKPAVPGDTLYWQACGNLNDFMMTLKAPDRTEYCWHSSE
jgi:hypothetical protein